MRILRRRRYDDVRRDYAVHGYLAKRGPSTAEEIAEKLGYKLDGLVMDLAVFKTIWKTIDSGWEDDVRATATQALPATPAAPGTPRRRLYWLAEQRPPQPPSATAEGPLRVRSIHTQDGLQVSREDLEDAGWALPEGAPDDAVFRLKFGTQEGESQ